MWRNQICVMRNVAGLNPKCTDGFLSVQLTLCLMGFWSSYWWKYALVVGVGVINYLTKTTVLLPLLLPLLSRDNGAVIKQLALMQLPWAYFETPGDQESVLGQKGRETITLCAFQLWLSEGSVVWVSTPGWGNMPNRRYSLCQPQPTHGNFRGQTRHTEGFSGVFPL